MVCYGTAIEEYIVIRVAVSQCPKSLLYKGLNDGKKMGREGEEEEHIYYTFGKKTHPPNRTTTPCPLLHIK